MFMMGWTCKKMQDQLCAKKILYATLEGKRAKLSWEDGVIQDVQRLGKRNWRHLEQNRD